MFPNTCGLHALGDRIRTTYGREKSRYRDRNLRRCEKDDDGVELRVLLVRIRHGPNRREGRCHRITKERHLPQKKRGLKNFFATRRSTARERYVTLLTRLVELDLMLPLRERKNAEGVYHLLFLELQEIILILQCVVSDVLELLLASERKRTH